MAHVLDGDVASSGPGQGFAGDAEIRRATRVPRVLDEAALVLQHEGERLLEAG
jgi:hypothetical protein